MPLKEQINMMKNVARDSEAIVAALGMDWLRKVFDLFGSSLSEWLTSVLQSLIMIVVMVIWICIMISCTKRTIVRSVLIVKYTPLKPVCVIDVPIQP